MVGKMTHLLWSRLLLSVTPPVTPPWTTSVTCEERWHKISYVVRKRRLFNTILLYILILILQFNVRMHTLMYNCALVQTDLLSRHHRRQGRRQMIHLHSSLRHHILHLVLLHFHLHSLLHRADDRHLHLHRTVDGHLRHRRRSPD